MKTIRTIAEMRAWVAAARDAAASARRRRGRWTASSRSTSALVHPDTLTPVAVLEGRVLLAVAARVGATRLIDNLLLDPVPSPVATSA